MQQVIYETGPLSQQRFVDDYLSQNRPVVVANAMQNWDLQQFSPQSLKKSVGHHIVHIYDDLFDLQNLYSLSEYIDGHFNKPPNAPRSNEYVRAYIKLADVDYEWADEIFAALSGAWQYPSFLPNRSMLVPYCSADNTIDATTSNFPYKGLFVSGKGARTRLHRDPFSSNAILCQLYGEKKILLFSPDKRDQVMKGEDFIDPQLSESSVVADAQVTLKAGEIIFLPRGWFHDVTTLSDSVSITWNFVHSSERETFCQHVSEYPHEQELDKVKFFIGNKISPNATAAEIITVTKTLFSGEDQ